jgi:branched-chain amino acid transport system substrate-binding protein
MGATMAADKINAAGGIKIGDKTYKIELVKVDTNEILDIAGAATAVERAITVDKVDFLVGGFRTEAVYPMSDVAMDYKKIFLGCGAATTELCTRVQDNYNKYKYWFRVTPVNSTFLVTTDFKMLGMVAAILKQRYGIEKPKVAIIAEKLAWADPMVAIAQQRLPAMGMEVVGTWRPSDTATDVTAELTAIAAKEPHIIFTTFSGPVGITYAKQLGELRIPACSVGINVEAQKKGFWEATGGKGEYEFTMNTYGRVPIGPMTIDFYDEFVRRTGEIPTYNAGTYDALYILKAAIEKAQSLDADALIPVIETNELHLAGAATTKFYPTTSKCPMCPHDIMYGPGYATGIGVQWIKGDMVVVWPKKEYGTKDTYGDWAFEYPGTVPYTVPPYADEKFKAAKPAEVEKPKEEKPAAPKLSFTPAEYKNDQLGFSIKYPKNWTEKKERETGKIIFYASEDGVPALSISYGWEGAFADIETQALTDAKGTDIKVGTPTETTLADGTKVTTAKVNWNIAGYDAETFAMGVQKGGKWILVNLTTVTLYGYDEARFKEIAFTFQSTK